ncbi:serine hydrolase domain-containing protein [Janthinobacterium sp. HLX7-2]|uniref:serine hydrolase domain-containing protein n=1 Tax=Janthinobacterium sp. HLX7-2 TaxID=1259331 RepID=UPI003F29370E
MKRRSMLGLGVSLALLQTGCAADPARLAWEKDFDAFMRDGLARTETPGMSVAVVRGENTLFARGYGWADIEAGKKADADTVFHVASVSKLVTATAAMVLLEQGAFQLDDKVSAYLDFPLMHPKFPDVPITFRHLLSHTSGISDAVYAKTPAFAVQGDPRLPLRDFVKGYLSRGGAWYDADLSFAARPGTEWRYSNVGVALLGYLVGRLNPDGLDVFTREHLFEPLGMDNTAWSLAGLPRRAVVATPYAHKEAGLRPLPPVGYPDWPAGLLRSSARDFARFLAIFSNGGRVDGQRYLQDSTLQLFFAPQATSLPPAELAVRQALIWVMRDVDGTPLASMSGNDPGTASIVCVERASKTAVLAFANVSADKQFRSFQKEVVRRLLAHGAGPLPRS